MSAILFHKHSPYIPSPTPVWPWGRGLYLSSSTFSTIHFLCLDCIYIFSLDKKNGEREQTRMSLFLFLALDHAKNTRHKHLDTRTRGIQVKVPPTSTFFSEVSDSEEKPVGSSFCWGSSSVCSLICSGWSSSWNQQLGKRQEWSCPPSLSVQYPTQPQLLGLPRVFICQGIPSS